MDIFFLLIPHPVFFCTPKREKKKNHHCAQNQAPSKIFFCPPVPLKLSTSSAAAYNTSWWIDAQEKEVTACPFKSTSTICIHTQTHTHMSVCVYYGLLWALQLPDSNFSVTGSISILIQSHGISSRWISTARRLAASAGSLLLKSSQTSPYPPGDYTAQLPG